MKPGPSRFIVFADGSSLTNPGGPGGTGYIVFDREERALRFGGRHYSVDGQNAVTNNRMELRAVLEALELLPRGATAEVHSDSQYLVNALTTWVHGWRRRGWMTSQGTPVLNRDLFEALLTQQAELAVRYSWVRGHAGHPANEAVDALAKSAAMKSNAPSSEQILAALQKAGVDVSVRA